jgi:hypothetical protein
MQLINAGDRHPGQDCTPCSCRLTISDVIMCLHSCSETPSLNIARRIAWRNKEWRSPSAVSLMSMGGNLKSVLGSCR